MSDLDAVLQENLSPKALGVLHAVRQIQAIGAKISGDIAKIEAEAFAADGAVCAVADGQGFLTDLVISDAALSELTVEGLEDAISDAMADASGLGQARGSAVLDGIDDRVAAAGLETESRS